MAQSLTFNANMIDVCNLVSERIDVFTIDKPLTPDWLFLPRISQIVGRNQGLKELARVHPIVTHISTSGYMFDIVFGVTLRLNIAKVPLLGLSMLQHKAVHEDQSKERAQRKRNHRYGPLRRRKLSLMFTNVPQFWSCSPLALHNFMFSQSCIIHFVIMKHSITQLYNVVDFPRPGLGYSDVY